MSCLATAAFCSAAAAGQELPASPSGGVSGRVTLTSKVRGTPLPSNVYLPRSIGGGRATPAVPEIQNVVVYLRGAVAPGPPPQARHAIQQLQETFHPRVLAITRGSTVVFPNADPFFHNVFSLSKAATFDLGRYPQGQTRAREFRKPGLVKVYCHIHSHMSATILVLDHPYFTIPKLDGSFSIPDVPPGRYTLVGWHERVGERTMPVDIASGRGVTVDLTLPVEDGP
jgi:plastocyanin